MTTALTFSVEDVLFDAEKRFNAVNVYQSNFKKECSYALQIIKGNDYLMKLAKANPDALQDAIANLAASGLTLNPNAKEAYLVPRGSKICTDPSYIGIANSATKEGHLLWVQAEIVRMNDTFEFQGVGKAPLHKMNPFSDRGEIIGAYVVAKTPSGEYLSTVMPVAEITEIRDRTEAWKAFKEGKIKSCPWETDFGEMAKKTAIKRGSKLWGKCQRLEKVLAISNENDGIDFEKERSVIPTSNPSTTTSVPDEKVFKNIRDNLIAKGRSEVDLVDYMNTQFGLKDDKKLNKIEDFCSAHVDYAYRLISSMEKKK